MISAVARFAALTARGAPHMRVRSGIIVGMCRRPAVTSFAVNSHSPAPLLVMQRRQQGALSKLLHESSDPYLLPIQEMDIPRIAAIVLTREGKELHHLFDGLIAVNVTLGAQVRSGAVTQEELDAAFSVYTEVLRHAPTTISSPCDKEVLDNNSNNINNNNSAAVHHGVVERRVPEDVWKSEWEALVEEFLVIFRASGDTRLS
ncbi:hypothetical protein LSM04_008108 [Trypanosoma melophagium]|uniref:uncharacterized protein n=1 Tax=Trypanosoma melophagium TaxID=715481 RepID=UPI00351A53BC|nr:hypothetical protein LSM04_008108 [Trypanosoma melophagium]